MGYQQKSYKKFVATAATATLVASAIVPVASAANFSDVAENSEFKTYIDSLSERGIIGGYESDNTFRPLNKLTRGQVAIMLGRWLKDNGATVPTDWDTNPRFLDVSSSNEELAQYAALVKDAGVFTGVGGKLNPYQNITRENMAVVLDRVAEEVAGVSLVELAEEADEKEVTDLNKANANYRDQIQALVNLEISTVSNFRPKEEVSRAQFAKFLYSTIEIIEEVTAPPTVEELQAQVASIVGTLPALTTITADNAEAAKATAATAATDLAAIETAITEGEYTEEEVAELNEAITEAETAIEAVVTKADQVIEDAKVLAVESVTSLNATQIQVKFNKAVTESSVIAPTTTTADVAGTLVNDVFGFKSLDSNNSGTNDVTANSSTAALSEDGKILTITANTGKVFEGRYDVTIEGVTDTFGKTGNEFKEVVNFVKDTVAPTITKTEKISANLVEVTFSEPISSLGNVTFRLEDGSVVSNITQSPTFASGHSSVIYNLANATAKGAPLATGVNVVATFVGVQDQNLNLLTPNPATVTFAKGAKDGVAPTVSTVTQTGAKEFAIKFSEELSSKPTIKVNATTIDSAKVVQDKNDKTKYVVTTPAALDGATTVAVGEGYADLSGEAGAAFSKVYTFVKDVVAAKATSVAVVQDATDGKQYLEITFDKNVELANGASVTVEGTQVKDYVTNAVDETATLAYKNDSNKKVVRVALSTLLDGTNPTTYNVGAAYDLDVAFTGVTSETGVAVDSTTADFTLVADGTPSSSGKVTVTSVTQSANNNNQLTVKFDGSVDLATATTAANYTVDGAVVESATASATSTDTITLTLKANSNTFTGIRNVTVRNVKKLNGTVAMDTKTIVSSLLKENVAPTVTSARLTGLNTIEVTFSEDVAAGSAADFVLSVGGQAVQTTVTTETQATATDNVLVLTLGTPVTAADLAQGLSLNAATTLDIVDSVGNKLSVPTAITVAQ